MIAGIDYSMTCPAITIGKSKNIKDCISFFYTDKKKFAGSFSSGRVNGMFQFGYDSEMERFNNITEWAMSILRKYKVDFVCVEGYSMGSKGKVFNIAENTGILKHTLWKNNIEFITPSPTTVKKHFTGKGNANKTQMFEAYLEKTGFDVASILGTKPDGNPVSDVVDSYAMLCYGFENR